MTHTAGLRYRFASFTLCGALVCLTACPEEDVRIDAGEEDNDDATPPSDGGHEQGADGGPGGTDGGHTTMTDSGQHSEDGGQSRLPDAGSPHVDAGHTIVTDAGNPQDDGGVSIEPDAGSSIMDGGHDMQSDAGDIHDAGSGIEADAGSQDDGGTLLDAGPLDGGDMNDGGLQDPCGVETLENLFQWPHSWPYDIESISITTDESWKNVISADDPFVAQSFYSIGNSLRWVKFSVLLKDPTTVYYQNSNTYPFHYDFMRSHLDPYVGLTAEEFETVALSPDSQEVILGAVVFPQTQFGTDSPNEYGIQLVLQEALHPDMLETIYSLVKSSIQSDGAADDFYFPSYETFASLPGDLTCAYQSYLADADIQISGVERWLASDGCYSTGWAVGRLRYIETEQIDTAYATGDLLPTDILLTDAIPAELPYVAGIITLSPSTPNSHVAILSQVYGIPFVYAHEEATLAEIDAMVEQEIAIDAQVSFWGTDGDGCIVDLYAIENAYDEETRDTLFTLKDPEPVDYTPMATAGTYHMDLDDVNNTYVGPEHIDRVGGKAAYFGLLRRAIPEHSPRAHAFTFDLWNSFLDQELDSGTTLRAFIEASLGDHTYPPNFAELYTDLEIVRDTIKSATFTSAQETAILDALSDFETDRKIRFRSSTNVEDTLSFTGAGLYDSNSGCIADDIDEDDSGPSHCDPNKESERGVFRAIRKVYASFYNENAFVERLRRGVDESEVGMALLVHYSFPDEIELANGVATYEQNNSSSVLVSMVSQPDAVSVTNPDTTATPEVMEVSAYSFGTFTSLRQRAELLPIGATVLDNSDIECVFSCMDNLETLSFVHVCDGIDDCADGSDEFQSSCTLEPTCNEYEQMTNYFRQVAAVFEEETGAQKPYVLDFEYKKVVDDGLVIKQVRQLPTVDQSNTNPTFLLDEGVDLCVFQGEYSNVYSNHRAKLHWVVNTRNIQLTSENISTSIFGDGTFSHTSGGNIVSLSGEPSDWPNRQYTVTEDLISEQWSIAFGDENPRFSVTTTLPLEKPVNEVPIITLRDLFLTGKIRHASDKPVYQWGNMLETVKEDSVRLEPCRSDVLPSGAILRERSFINEDYQLVTRFYHPPHPQGIVAGYTAPMQKWIDTTITGLTTTPIVLTSYYSQTYRPGHHNFSENFLFEPRLDPALTQSQRAELQDQDVFRILFIWGGNGLIGLENSANEITWHEATP